MESQHQQLRIALIGERPLLRHGLGELIDRQSEHAVVLQCGSADEAVRRMQEAPADLVILDLWSDGVSGLEVLRLLAGNAPEVPVLVISPYPNPALAARVLQSGASGYITPEEDVSELRRAISIAADGGRYLPPAVQNGVVEHLLAGERWSDPAVGLSHRELQVFQLLGEGCASVEIARRLGISEKTVHTHRESIKRKLGLGSAVALVHTATLWVADLQRGSRVE